VIKESDQSFSSEEELNEYEDEEDEAMHQGMEKG